MDHRALAIEEAQAWEALSTAERSTYGSIRHYWTVRDPQRKQSEVEIRYSLYRAGCEPLWEEVRQGLSLYTARAVLADARKSECSVLEMLERYRTCMRVEAGNGYHYKYKNLPKTASYAPQREATGVEWQEATDAVERAVRAQLVGEDPVHIDQIVGQTMLDVRLAFNDAKRQTQRRLSANPARTALINDCHRFGVSPPKAGMRVDPGQVWKTRKLLLRDLHPDRNGGFQDPQKDSVRAEIEAAYQRILTYNAQFEGENHG